MKLTNRIVNNVKAHTKNTFIGNYFLRSRVFINSFKYSDKYKKLIFGHGSLKDIEVISIQFCAVCNLNCRYCFLEKRDRPAFLNLDIYKKLLFEICENRKYQIKIMEWPISGCFFLHPAHQEVINMTREYKERYPHFTPWIILNDNMMLFDKDKVDFILETDVIDQIICSIDGVDKETFERMRPNTDFNKVIENTLYLLDRKKKLQKKVVVQINNGLNKECLSKRPEPRLREIFDKAGYVTRWEPVDWNESFHTDAPHYVSARHFCSFVFESVTLSTSGAILKCCMDLKELTKYGNFSKDSLESIWFSKKRESFLKMMYEGRRNSVPGCNNCSITYVSQNNKG